MITYALIGCGRIAQKHLLAYEQNQDRLKLAALCDRSPQKALALRPEGSDARIYSDYRLMLLEEKPQVVAIATDSGSHAEIALDAIETGCHVIVEKPMALSLFDADRMISAAQWYGVTLGVCHQNRFNPAVEALAGALDEGRFGRLCHASAQIRWNRQKSYYDQAPWRGKWEEDGGALMNQCIHAIDLLRWSLGGTVSEVFAYTANLLHPYIEGEDLGVAVLRFSSGALGVLEGSVNVYPENLEETLSVFGEKATFCAGGKSLNRVEHWRFEGEDTDHPALVSEEPPDIYGFGHGKLYRDFLDAVEQKRPPRVSGEEGRQALEMVLGIYRSAREHQPVYFPLGSYSTREMKGMFSPRRQPKRG